MEADLRDACTWAQAFQDDLVRDLLDVEPPFVFVPPEVVTDSSNTHSINHLTSTLYSGPTISDIETALLASSYANDTQDFSSLDRISEMERGMSSLENRYILRIKSSANVMADDGYKWRKYGQKSIKNSLNPRSYYKCTNPRCGAKKQVERSNDDPDTLIVTYEGLHLHYTYPFFLFDQPETPRPPTKKFKSFGLESNAHQSHQGSFQDTDESISDKDPGIPSSTLTNYQEELPEVAINQQGLLEDMVPLLIRNPTVYTSSSKSGSSSSSYPSPPASPSFARSLRY